MHTNISVYCFIQCLFCVVNYSSTIKGYFVAIKNEKWGNKLVMNGTFFNMYLDGEPDPDKACVYGKWEPEQTSNEDHMWETDECDKDDKYLTLCQKLLCKCIDFVHK